MVGKVISSTTLSDILDDDGLSISQRSRVGTTKDDFNNEIFDLLLQSHRSKLTSLVHSI
jgi:hypothetical protein